MKKQPRSLLLLSLFLVAAAAAALGVALGRPDPPIRLPDGSRLTLEGVTYGKEHEIVLGPRWAKLIRPFVPMDPTLDFDRRFGCRVYSRPEEDPDTLVFWTYRRDIHPKVQGWELSWNTRVVAFDEHGCEAASLGYSRGTFFSWPPKEVLEAWCLPVFPRRGKTVGVRAYSQDATGRWIRVFEKVTPNPAPGPHPVWKAPSLPITAQDGDLAVTLTGLTPGVKPPDIVGTAPAEAWTRATFRVSSDGRPAPEWEPAAITVSDASGNMWNSPSRLGSGLEDRGAFFIRGAPWRDEAAWKLRVELAPAGPFAPKELWTFRNLPASRTTRSARPHRPIFRGGTALEVQRILGPYSLFKDPGKHGWNGSVEVRLSPAAPGARPVFVGGVDDRRRPVAGLCFGTPGTTGGYSFRLRLPPDAKTLDLTFAVQPTRVVEFLAAVPRP